MNLPTLDALVCPCCGHVHPDEDGTLVDANATQTIDCERCGVQIEYEAAEIIDVEGCPHFIYTVQRTEWTPQKFRELFLAAPEEPDEAEVRASIRHATDLHPGRDGGES